MTEQTETLGEIEEFIGQWSGSSSPMRDCFQQLFRLVQGLEGVILAFIARPGVSYSFRPKHQHQRNREMFAIIDVIDDTPDERWLSVCFYGDMVTDPEERGEVIPGGLAGSDGYCFDMYESDETFTAYLQERLVEAWRHAAE